jgi:hypothetical protein
VPAKGGIDRKRCAVERHGHEIKAIFQLEQLAQLTALGEARSICPDVRVVHDLAPFCHLGLERRWDWEQFATAPSSVPPSQPARERAFLLAQ